MHLWLLCLLLPVVLGQDVADECPEKFGFYADAVQCDRYYECKDFKIIDHYCPDGLVFDEASEAFAKCSFPFSVNCSDRPELQPAVNPTEQCPRLNGYFGDEEDCSKFYFCVDGVANPIVCPESLIFDPDKGQCAFSDQVKRRGCSSEEVYQFTCPKGKSSPHEHPRYPDPLDCQYFYICIGGKDARRNGCTNGLVFDPDTLACSHPRKVEGPCRTWYNETYLEQLGSNVAKAAAKINAGPTLDERLPGRKRVGVRRRRPRPQVTQQVVQPDVQFLDESLDVQRGAQPDNRAQDDRIGRPVARRPVEVAAGAVRRQRPRQRVRTRVTRPKTRAEPEPEIDDQPDVSGGPPQFRLSSPEAIQQFRESNIFEDETNRGQEGGRHRGRLTVLNRPQVGRPRPISISDDLLESQLSSEVDDVSDFGSDSLSSLDDASLNERLASSFSSRRRPTTGRRRLQATKIEVSPQVQLASQLDAEGEETDFFKRVVATRRRGRGERSINTLTN